MVWRRLKELPLYSKVIWYGIEATLQSATTVDIDVYDMESSAVGGIGDKILTAHAVPLNNYEIGVALPIILKCVDDAATQIYEDRLANIRRLGIEAVRKEIFGV